MIKQIAGLLLCWMVSVCVVASNVAFLKYAVIADFSEADIEQLQKEYIQVLKTKKPGEVYKWQNSKTKNGGEITVIKQFEEKTNACKRLKFKNYAKQQSAVSYFNFCLIDQKWLLVN